MRKQRRLAYLAIKDVNQKYPGHITKFLDVIGVSRQAYYKGIHRHETPWESRNELLKQRIQYWFDFHYQGKGAGGLLTDIESDIDVSFKVTEKQVKRCMRELGIRCLGLE